MGTPPLKKRKPSPLLTSTPEDDTDEEIVSSEDELSPTLTLIKRKGDGDRRSASRAPLQKINIDIKGKSCT